jgi:ankyrin repeat protein
MNCQLVSIPLLNAAESGHFEDVKLLLEHGADISQRNYYGLTGNQQISTVSRNYGNRRIMSLIALVNFSFPTALHRASEEGRTEIVRLLLDMGAGKTAALLLCSLPCSDS